MGFKLIPLWTDVLVYVLLATIAAFAYQARHKEHLRAPWRHVARRKLAMSAMVVLLVYVAIGILDSIHFKLPLQQQQNNLSGEVHYGPELSVFDLLCGPLRTQTEKTYSEPFATRLFAKENIETPSGQIRDYPRLRFGGAHLNSEQDKAQDIVLGVLFAFILALLSVLIISAALSAWLVWRQQSLKQNFNQQFLCVLQGKTEIPWQSMLLTLGGLLLVFFTIVVFAGKYHILGTDKVGQDVLYLTLKSIRTGLLIGTLTTLIMLPFAIMMGIMAGYFRGWVDDVVQYIYTTLNAIPGVLLIAAAILSLQVYMANNPELFDSVSSRADMRLVFLCAILGVTSWTGLCRLLRGETLKLSQVDYIEAAHAFGVGHFKLMTRHILPNVMHIVLIAVVLDFSGLVLAEAVLSYVGVGVDPSMISWGNMINSARLELAREPVVWWSLIAAFIFMFVLVLAANLFSDAVRDAFDPRVNRAT
ncbi:MAG: ABC transporter permease [Gammaproteobacteria bacterium]|nr:ABC transporter permease [Gammaproteobacteria bacterium]MDH5799191.1 ABC transporter permease [Gammaproteobacteria bacterium]